MLLYPTKKKCNLERVILLLQIFTLNLNKVDALKVHTRLGLQKSIYVLDGVMQYYANQFLLECIAYFSFNMSYFAIMQQSKPSHKCVVGQSTFVPFCMAKQIIAILEYMYRIFTKRAANWLKRCTNTMTSRFVC